MKLTETHIRYWQERKAVPEWAKATRNEARKRWPLLLRTAEIISVNQCVNAHADLRLTPYEVETGNCLNLFRASPQILQRLGYNSLREYVAYLACHGQGKRRKSNCAKWLKRMQRSPG